MAAIPRVVWMKDRLERSWREERPSKRCSWAAETPSPAPRGGSLKAKASSPSRSPGAPARKKAARQPWCAPMKAPSRKPRALPTGMAT